MIIMDKPGMIEFMIDTFNNMTDEYYMEYGPQRTDDCVVENVIIIYKKDIPKEEQYICPTLKLTNTDKYSEEILIQDLKNLLLDLPDDYKEIKKEMEIIGNPMDELSKLSKEDVLDKCFLMIANTEKDKAFLEGMAIKQFMDLSYYFVIDIECDEYVIRNIIKEDLLKNMNITIDELYEAAMANTKEILNIKSIKLIDYIDLLREKIGEEGSSIIPFPVSSLVVHPEENENGEELYGSIIISDTETMDSLCDELKSDKIIIVPCSVYELIVDVYNNDVHDYSGFNNIVSIVNMSMEEKDVLSDNCYIYDCNSKEFMFLEDDK